MTNLRSKQTKQLTHMQFSDIQQSQVLNESATISELRATLNSAYSTAPKELDEVFAAGLDQIADQQIKVNEVLLLLFKKENLKEAENAIANAITEAQRAALRVARSFADNQSEKAQDRATALASLPRDSAQLLDDKRQLDEQFEQAIARHEKNDIIAFPQLLEIARKYNEWTLRVQAAISGVQGIVKSERKKLRLQIFTTSIAIIALIASIINIIINILSHSH